MRLSHLSIKLEIIRNISSYITTKLGEIFAIIPIVSNSKATIYLKKNKANKITKLLKKRIHLVPSNVSFLVLEFINFYILLFKYKN